MKRAEPTERPDFVIHSYTKDLSGPAQQRMGLAVDIQPAFNNAQRISR